MKPAPRSRRLRSVLIPLNLIIVTAMLISLLLGTPPVTPVAAALAIAAALSAFEILSKLGVWQLVLAPLAASVRWLPPVAFGKVGIAAVTIAIIAILLAALAGYYSRDSRETASGVPVVVAATDIPAGTVISEEMVKVVEVPEHERVARAMSDRQGVVGKITRVPLTKGEQIIAASGPADWADSAR